MSLRAIILIFAITLFPAPLWSQDKSELSLSINVSEDTPWGRAGKRFADAVRYRTGGRIRIKPYFDGQLFRGQQTTEFKLLQDGLAEFAIGSTINWSPQVKELNLFVLPFMFSRFSDAVQAGDPESSFSG
jgi:TRAP-type C4-dicarboxylate transport system substrate-binding protein